MITSKEYFESNTVNRDENEDLAVAYREELESLQTLCLAEIVDLVTYEYYERPQDIDGQIRKYYLYFKARNPDAAEAMMRDLKPILQQGIQTIGHVRNLCRALSGHMSGFVIHFNNQRYTAADGQF